MPIGYRGIVFFSSSVKSFFLKEAHMHEEKLLMDIFINPHQVPHYVSYAFLASIILIVVALLVKSSIKLIPRGIQNFMESVIDAILNLCDENIGHHWAGHFFPLT